MKTSSTRVAIGVGAAGLFPGGSFPNLIIEQLIIIRDNFLMIEIKAAIGKNPTDSQKHAVKLLLREMLY
jgi:hypothetical protein